MQEARIQNFPTPYVYLTKFGAYTIEQRHIVSLGTSHGQYITPQFLLRGFAAGQESC